MKYLQVNTKTGSAPGKRVRVGQFCFEAESTQLWFEKSRDQEFPTVLQSSQRSSSIETVSCFEVDHSYVAVGTDKLRICNSRPLSEEVCTFLIFTPRRMQASSIDRIINDGMVAHATTKSWLWYAD
jgi:hypothetical protein